MKRIIITMTAILIILYVALSMLGGGLDYKAEKIFYKAMKTYSKIAQNPDVSPPAMLISVENDLKRLLKKYPDTLVAKTASVSLADLYIAAKRYEEARLVLNKAMSKYKDDVMIMSSMQFMKGNIYEKTKQWGKALVEYTILRDRYYNTQLGMQIPLYIGKYYDLKGDEAASKAAYDEAINFYRNMERSNSKKVMGYMASMLIIEAYVKLNDYESAGATLELTIMRYPSPESFNQLLPLIEMIYVQKLANTEKAIALYKKAETFVKAGKLTKMIDKRIAVLEKGEK